MKLGRNDVVGFVEVSRISDGAGIWSGQWLESKCKALGFEDPEMKVGGR